VCPLNLLRRLNQYYLLRQPNHPGQFFLVGLLNLLNQLFQYYLLNQLAQYYLFYLLNQLYLENLLHQLFLLRLFLHWVLYL
jgi:hypothetical protein